MACYASSVIGVLLFIAVDIDHTPANVKRHDACNACRKFYRTDFAKLIAANIQQVLDVGVVDKHVGDVGTNDKVSSTKALFGELADHCRKVAKDGGARSGPVGSWRVLRRVAYFLVELHDPRFAGSLSSAI